MRVTITKNLHHHHQTHTQNHNHQSKSLPLTQQRRSSILKGHIKPTYQIWIRVMASKIFFWYTVHQRSFVSTQFFYENTVEIWTSYYEKSIQICVVVYIPPFMASITILKSGRAINFLMLSKSKISFISSK
jgi:hypothetical protein